MGLGLACPMEEVSGSGPMGQAGRQLFCSVLSAGGLPPAGSEPRGRKAAATIGEAAVAVDAYLGSGPARGRISRHLAAVRDPGPLLNVERSAPAPARCPSMRPLRPPPPRWSRRPSSPAVLSRQAGDRPQIARSRTAAAPPVPWGPSQTPPPWGRRARAPPRFQPSVDGDQYESPTAKVLISF